MASSVAKRRAAESKKIADAALRSAATQDMIGPDSGALIGRRGVAVDVSQPSHISQPSYTSQPNRKHIDADGDISELELVEDDEELLGKPCGECGGLTVEIVKNNKRYIVCQDAMREDPLCSWYKGLK